jgi:Rhodanese-related sulfurtransferase
MTGKFKKATIVDVRTPEEFEGGHVPNAINIPLDVVPQRIIEFKLMQKPIVAYCRSGNRSAIAVSLLTQNGINEAINGGSLDEVRQILKT